MSTLYVVSKGGDFIKNVYGVESYDDESCSLISKSDGKLKTFQIVRDNAYFNNKGGDFYLHQKTLVAILQKKIENISDFDFVEVPYHKSEIGLLSLPKEKDKFGNGKILNLLSEIVTLKYEDENTWVGHDFTREELNKICHLEGLPSFEVAEKDVEKKKPIKVGGMEHWGVERSFQTV